MEAAKLLLRDSRLDVDMAGKNALTALHVATHYDHLDIVLLLMQHQANQHAVAKVTSSSSSSAAAAAAAAAWVTKGWGRQLQFSEKGSL